jgi:hypothetical protein
MTVNDVTAMFYAIVAVEVLCQAWVYYRAPNGLARPVVIADKVVLALFMGSLLASYVMRACGVGEATMETQRIVTRWLTVIYALVLAPQLWLMWRKGPA